MPKYNQFKIYLIVICILYFSFTGINIFLYRQVRAADINFQPTAPYHAAFYYPWYKTKTTDGAYSYWNDHGNNPPNTWFSHYIPDPKPNVFDPATELYSANDYSNFKWQITKMAEAKLEVAISSWWGIDTKEDLALKNILNTFMPANDNPYPNLRWAIYYEKEGFGDPSVSEITTDLDHIKNNFINSKYFLKVNNKPVVFVYGGAEDMPGTLTSRWKSANTNLGNTFYIVLKVFPNYQNDTNQPDSWHQYAPAVRSGFFGTDSAFVSPGFWLDDAPTTGMRLARNITEFRTELAKMVAYNATWKLIETWNEWGEGTSVEPGQETTIDNNGKEIIKNNGTLFGNAYIDELKNALPPLEAGTGYNNCTNTGTETGCNILYDFDGNGTVEIKDIIILIKIIFNEPTNINPNSQPDINSDGKINLLDVILFLQKYFS